MSHYKTFEEMQEEYKKLYPEIFTQNYVFGTSDNMIQVMSKLPITETDESSQINSPNYINLPYYSANILKFEYRFHRFNPTQKHNDFNWKNKNIKHADNGDIFLIGSYATYFKDLEQTYYFDMVNSNLDYTGKVKIWNRGKKQLRHVFNYEDGKILKYATNGELQNKTPWLYIDNEIKILQENTIEL
jgi:hypothetical protein